MSSNSFSYSTKKAFSECSIFLLNWNNFLCFQIAELEDEVNRLRSKLNNQQPLVIDIDDDDDDDEDDGEEADISSDANSSANANRLFTDRDSDGIPHSKKRSLRTSTDC